MAKHSFERRGPRLKKKAPLEVPPGPAFIEVECLPGLEGILLDEIQERKFPALALSSPGVVRGPFSLVAVNLYLRLRTARIVTVGYTVAGQRPSAILGDKAFRGFCDLLRQALDCSSFHGLRLNAPGRHTALMARISTAVSSAFGIEEKDDGDLLLRIRRAGEGHWELLARASRRPLSVRQWKKHDLRGAINPTLASAMLRLIPSGLLAVDITAGTGTILAEAVEAKKFRSIIGLEIERAVVQLGRENLRSFRRSCWQMVHGDARAIPLREGVADAVVSNLPWGEAIGTIAELSELYRGICLEGDRVLRERGHAVLLSQRGNVLLPSVPNHWQLVREIAVLQGGFHPTIFVFRKGAVARRTRRR